MGCSRLASVPHPRRRRIKGEFSQMIGARGSLAAFIFDMLNEKYDCLIRPVYEVTRQVYGLCQPLLEAETCLSVPE